MSKELYRDNGFAVVTDMEDGHKLFIQGEPILSIESVAENWILGVIKKLNLNYDVISITDVTTKDKGRWHSFWVEIECLK